ncbi:DUF6443 domain-containing protein [Chryseobacterium sp. PMSZPI]|uniref:DUF6443 domain-containing protein n=1 Tax=Chryseobacterium sp. PMSZPI TaxID=1033900 RepID=UPI00399F20DD
MKKIIIPISALLVTSTLQAQLIPLPNTENYVQTKTYLDYNGTTPTKSSETVQYFDGLGRPKQVVGVKASPSGKDVVTHIEYDQFGRQVKDYLPIPQSGTQNGAIYTSPLGNASSIYGGEKIYSEKVLENSPLDRIQQQIQVGNDWANKPVKLDYEANIWEDYVRKYETTTTWVEGRTQTSVQLLQYFGASQLYKNTVTDEDGNKTIEFKNGKGQLILSRKVLNASENADTYYVYNEYDQLAFVIPPLASAQVVVQDTVDKLYYEYRYDGKGRLVEKKVPGKGWEYMVYDKADRLILSQDAILRAQNKWLITKYDPLGRVAYTGLLQGGDRVGRQANISNGIIIEGRSNTGFTRNGITVYYNDNNFVGEIPTILSVNYYDTYPSYSFNPTFPTSIQGELTLTETPTSDGRSTKGLPLMSLVKNIEDDNWTKNYTYYDQKGRTIGTYSINHLGGYTKTESKLDFAGIPQNTLTKHLRRDGEAEVTVKERFVYDNQNRLLKHYHQVDYWQEELLAENTYDELSQLTNKKVGSTSSGTPLQSIDYAYNIRGWMTDINKSQMSMPDLGGKLFSYKIKYNQKDGITNPDQGLFSGKDVKPKFNGNITEVDWRAVESIGANPPLTPKRYGYAYDGLNRLTAGYYQNPNNPYSKENLESLAYDANGNITNLYRTSVLEYNNTTPTLIDNLNYTYTGNKLTNVTDSTGNSSGYEGYGGGNVAYDANGNMTSISGKGINQIGYNILNLPSTVNMMVDYPFDMEYLYRADGTKLKKKSTSTIAGYQTVTTTIENSDYLDGFQYLNKTSSSSGGSSELTGAKFAYELQAFSLDPIIIGPLDPPFGGGGLNPIPIDPIIKNPHHPELQFFPTAEGFYDYQRKQYIYQYKDHLGNIRVSFGRNNNTGLLEITDSNDFYPFGMNHLKTGNAYFGTGKYQNYKYQGQELQETGWYSFKWRNYMPDVGRFFNIDPLSEKYAYQSHYNFSENRVIDARELEGLEAIPVNGNENNVLWKVRINNNLGTDYSKTLLSDTSKILSQNGVRYSIVEDPTSPFTINLSLPKVDLKNMQFINGQSQMDGNTYDGSVTSQDNPRTLSHELAHKAGQSHIFENESKVPNITENKSNLLNSRENPDASLQDNNGTELKEAQSQDMKTHIRIIYENKQRQINNVSNNNNAGNTNNSN